MEPHHTYSVIISIHNEQVAVPHTGPLYRVRELHGFNSEPITPQRSELPKP